MQVICTPLYQAITKISPTQKADWTKVQQYKRELDESVLDFFERFKKTFRQYWGLSPDSSEDHQNDPLLNSAFLEELDEELITLIKQHKFNWPTTGTNELATLADERSQTIQKKRTRLPKSWTYSSSN